MHGPRTSKRHFAESYLTQFPSPGTASASATCALIAGTATWRWKAAGQVVQMVERLKCSGFGARGPESQRAQARTSE